jgi:NAD-dependent dihydropyrimidine dehydrogenase PreA subunit
LTNKTIPVHYVGTLEQAADLIRRHKDFWVCNCGCREDRKKGKCRRSRIDVCLFFRGDVGSSGSGLKKITRRFAEGILHEAYDKWLVSRPFRNDNNRRIIDGICFCCDDCCGYFLDPAEICDKGKYVEKTDMKLCTGCGSCVDVCYFKARKLKSSRLKITRSKCYGCGLCIRVCPAKAVKISKR